MATLPPPPPPPTHLFIERTADSQDNCITGTANNTQLANLLNYKKRNIGELRNYGMATLPSPPPPPTNL